MSEQATDAKPSVESSSTETQVVQSAPSQPPAEGGQKPEPESKKEEQVPFHNHPRFKELIEEKNSDKKRIEGLEKELKRLSKVQESLTPKEAPADKYIKKLVEKGMDEDAAKALAETMFELSSETAKTAISPVQEKTAQQEINQWVEKFSDKHKDYEQVEPRMYKVLESLPELTQELIASDSLGLELLYYYVKGQDMEEELKKAEQKGKDEAYANKQLKESVSPSGASVASPPGQPISMEDVGKMDLDTYKKNRDQIMKRYREMVAQKTGG